MNGKPTHLQQKPVARNTVQILVETLISNTHHRTAAVPQFAYHKQFCIARVLLSHKAPVINGNARATVNH